MAVPARLKKSSIKTNDKPLDKSALDELIKFSGHTLDVILEFTPHDGGAFLIYTRYTQDGKRVTRQIYTQRSAPRRFKNFHRALKWARDIGFRRCDLTTVNLSEYCLVSE